MTTSELQDQISPPPMSDEAKAELAELYVSSVREVYYHFSIYAVSVILMIVVNLLVTPEKLWFIFPMLGWGMGMFGHWFTVFGKFHFLGRQWEDRKVRELIEKGRF